MTEFIKRRDGGFYVVDDRHPPLLVVRRATNQILDPCRGTPFPEIPHEERFVRALLGDDPGPFDWSNRPRPLSLTQESLEDTIRQLRV